MAPGTSGGGTNFGIYCAAQARLTLPQCTLHLQFMEVSMIMFLMLTLVLSKV